ncbi:MAG: hypothetical protein JY451_05650 [Erythrobacter sp.]|nr:MAG: hypothetical protein JY451_05650 [Erythrobacter sp.]
MTQEIEKIRAKSEELKSRMRGLRASFSEVQADRASGSQSEGLGTSLKEILLLLEEVEKEAAAVDSQLIEIEDTFERARPTLNKIADDNKNDGEIWERWLMASSLSVNSAAAVFVLQSEKFDQRSQAFAALWFLAGIAVALIFGALRSAASRKYFLSHLYSESDASDLFALISNADKRRAEAAKDAKQLGAAAFIFRDLSFLCFLVGSMIVVEGFL